MLGPELILSGADRETQQDNSWTLAYPSYTILHSKQYYFDLGYALQSGTLDPVAMYVKFSDGVQEVLSDVIYAYPGQQWKSLEVNPTLPSGWNKLTSSILVYKDPPRPGDDVYFNHASLKEVLKHRTQYLPTMGIG